MFIKKASHHIFMKKALHIYQDSITCSLKKNHKKASHIYLGSITSHLYKEIITYLSRKYHIFAFIIIKKSIVSL